MATIRQIPIGPRAKRQKSPRSEYAFLAESFQPDGIPLAAQEIADLPVKRDLTLREARKLGGFRGRPINLEASLAFLRGHPSYPTCNRCTKGYGPFTKCVSLDGYFHSACTNCAYNDNGDKCEFHEERRNETARTDSTGYRIRGMSQLTKNPAWQDTGHVEDRREMEHSFEGHRTHSADRSITPHSRSSTPFQSRTMYVESSVPRGDSVLQKQTDLFTNRGRSPINTAPRNREKTEEELSSSMKTHQQLTIHSANSVYENDTIVLDEGPATPVDPSRAEKPDRIVAAIQRVAAVLNPEIKRVGNQSQTRKRLLLDAILIPQRGETFYAKCSKLFRLYNTIYCLRTLNEKIIKKLKASKQLCLRDTTLQHAEVAALVATLDNNPELQWQNNHFTIDASELRELGLKYHESGLLVPRTTAPFLDAWPTFRDDEVALVPQKDSVSRITQQPSTPVPATFDGPIIREIENQNADHLDRPEKRTVGNSVTQPRKYQAVSSGARIRDSRSVDTGCQASQPVISASVQTPRGATVDAGVQTEPRTTSQRMTHASLLAEAMMMPPGQREDEISELTLRLSAIHEAKARAFYQAHNLQADEGGEQEQARLQLKRKFVDN